MRFQNCFIWVFWNYSVLNPCKAAVRNETDKINSDCLFGLISGFRIMVHFCLAKNFRPARCEYIFQFIFHLLYFIFVNLFFAQYLLASNLSLNLAILAHPSSLISFPMCNIKYSYTKYVVKLW